MCRFHSQEVANVQSQSRGHKIIISHQQGHSQREISKPHFICTAQNHKDQFVSLGFYSLHRCDPLEPAEKGGSDVTEMSHVTRCYKEARIRGNRRGRGHKREFQNVMRFLRGSSVRRCDVAQHLWASSAALSGWSCGSTQQRNQRGADTTRSVGD